MLRNYYIIAMRNLMKHKSYTFINVLGLAIGIACAAMLFLFIRHELSYDSYHQNADRIYRATIETDDHHKIAKTAFALAPKLNIDFPEITAVRFFKDRTRTLFRKDEKQFYESRMFWADADVLTIFSFPQISGDPQTALAEPYSVVLTAETAQKYFGKLDVLGETLTINWNKQDHEMKVTGVLENIPSNSHFVFDMLISFSTSEHLFPENSGILDNWTFIFAHTYLLLPPNLQPRNLEKQFPVFAAKHAGEEENYKSIISELQPLADIHLYSHYGGEIEPNGNIVYLYIAGIIALLILAIACINYTNLATARSANRAKEIGVRKVAGANRLQLIKQFLGESILLSLLALVLSVVLIELCLPTFNQFVAKDLTFIDGGNWGILLLVVFIILAVGLLSGLYPAIFLSSFQPIFALKGTQTNDYRNRSLFRKLLVVSQFAISIGLIISAIVIYDQLTFMQNKELGLQKDQVIIIPHGRKIRENPEHLKSEFMKHPNVASVTISSHIPGERLTIAIGATPENGNPDGSEEPWPIAAVSVDKDFLKTLGLDLAAGRNFSEEFPTDVQEAFILNETAVRQLNWDNAIGQPFSATFRTGQPSLPVETRNGNVIGVVKDAHFESLHSEIEPVAFLIKPYWYYYISVKVRSENLPNTLEFLEQKWSEIQPGYPFEYHFLDDTFQTLYEQEEAWGTAIGFFSMLAIFIACLGLFGLAAFSTQRRIKEIGIRKTLGATVPNIVLMLSREFALLVLIANILAWPIAYWGINSWLQNFAYQIDIDFKIFLLSGIITFFIALLTITYQTLKAAFSNPVKALRHE